MVAHGDGWLPTPVSDSEEDIGTNVTVAKGGACCAMVQREGEQKGSGPNLGILVIRKFSNFASKGLPKPSDPDAAPLLSSSPLSPLFLSLLLVSLPSLLDPPS